MDSRHGRPTFIAGILEIAQRFFADQLAFIVTPSKAKTTPTINLWNN
jgi:hypothetical protein